MRKSFYFGDHDLNCVDIEAGKPRFNLAIMFDIGGSECEVCSLHIALPFLLNLFITLQWRNLSKFLRVPYDTRRTGFSLSPELAILNIWYIDNNWGNEREGVHLVSIPGIAILGNWKFERETLWSGISTITMLEGDYKAEVTQVRLTWTRKRCPLLKKIKISWDFDFDNCGGVPIPGKGESAWDLGEDAIFSTGSYADTLEQATEEIRNSILDRREKYGGTNWVPEVKGDGA